MADLEKELYRLCKEGTHEEIVALLERGVNPNVPYVRKDPIGGIDLDDEEEWVDYEDYPIHVAASHQSLETIKLLVAKGADPKVKDFWKSEPLMYAAEGHNFPVIKYLVEECGNDPALQNDDGLMPYWAVRDAPEMNRWLVNKAKELDPEFEEWYDA